MPTGSDKTAEAFHAAVWGYYRRHGRHDLPWRQPAPNGSFDPYCIMVSELMLQQTQVGRVIPKYEEFLDRFQTVQELAAAPLGDVLRVWNGLGYNRRAKFLWQAAGRVVQGLDGILPADSVALQALPGIGPNTAGAIMAYAFNQPAIFVETNIRTVFIHHFFNDRNHVKDSEILQLVAEILNRQRPRENYWALMDYGSHLKQTIGNLNHRGKSYIKQSRFEGSARQVRGQVIRSLGQRAKPSIELAREIDDERLEGVISELLKEGLIQRRGSRLSL